MVIMFEVFKCIIFCDIDIFVMVNILIYMIVGIKGGIGIMFIYKVDKKFFIVDDLIVIIVSLDGME